MDRKRLRCILLLYLILGSWKGYVALFNKGAAEPTQIFPYQVSSLPPEDQAELEKGIIIRSDDKLQQILEDYLS